MQVMSYDVYGQTPEEVAEEIENIFPPPGDLEDEMDDVQATFVLFEQMTIST